MTRQTGLLALTGIVYLAAAPALAQQGGQVLALAIDANQIQSTSAGWFGPSTSTDSALQGASANPHLDLAGTGRSEDACTFCHTPIEQGLGLRADSGAGFMPYASATTDMPSAAGPGPQSLVCLSCHDGVTGSSHGLGAGAPLIDVRDSVLPAWLVSALGGARSVGRDPRGEHPVAVHYLDGRDRELHPRASVEMAGLPFYGPARDQLECTTCHDPHRNENKGYLRLSNSRSRLCLTCHDK